MVTGVPHNFWKNWSVSNSLTALDIGFTFGCSSGGNGRGKIFGIFGVGAGLDSGSCFFTFFLGGAAGAIDMSSPSERTSSITISSSLSSKGAITVGRHSCCGCGIFGAEGVNIGGGGWSAPEGETVFGNDGAGALTCSSCRSTLVRGRRGG